MATRRTPASSPAPKTAPTTLLRVPAPLGTAQPPALETVQLKGSGRRIELQGSARAAGGGTDVAVRGDELVRVEYDEGIVRWVRYDDLMREQGRRSAQARGAGGEAVWEFDPVPAAMHDAPSERGLLGFGIKALEIFDVDVSGAAALALCRKFELSRLGREPGLYRVGVAEADGPAVLEPVSPAVVQAGKPVLLFLHGTASNFSGGFKHLFEPLPGEAGDAARALRREWRRRYGGEVYAWEHRSLSESPIRNVWGLVSELPAGVQLHLVSHSRGGLLGELLGLGQRERTEDPLAGPLLPRLFEQEGIPEQALGMRPLSPDEAAERRAAYAADLALFSKLVQALDAKQVQVQRFVRVACPARGTTLASGRLDKWLSWLNAVMPDNFFGDVVDFVLKVVKERTDPRTLPGLEAMMPGSGLTNLLRLPGLRTQADLSVIAGDTDPRGLFSKLKMLATDAFFGGEHDLVVNTGSMYGGVARSNAQARFRLAKGDEVNHFNYFRNRESVQWLAAGLGRAEGDAAGYQPLEQARHEEPRWRSAMRSANALGAPRPIAIVVPGTMGSALEAQGSRVWLHYARLLAGGLGRIGMGQADVEPVDLLDDFYGPLLEHLTRTHKVLICPYDWRMSVREGAQRLTAKLNEALAEAETRGQPVHIVAHSMGGLVARAMAADGGEGTQAWRRMKALEGSRLLMLGTPNRGSYEAVRWLTGFNPTQNKLALLDITRSVHGVIDIVRQYPGLAELLPWHQDPNPWGEAATWRALRDELGAGWAPIEQAVLRQAQATWKLLATAAPEPQHMIYVAGCQKATVMGHLVEMETDEAQAKVLKWVATGEGDGTVTWESGRLPGVATYYAPDTGHDELCSNDEDRAIFRGYVDLLLTGRTDQLPASPPATARSVAGQPASFVLPPQPMLDDAPDAASRDALGFGGTPRRRRGEARAPSALLQVSVRHGDLRYARFPVLVGHYVGDTIVNAEAAIDAQMRGSHPQGPLTRKRDLGRYPGPLGTSAVFFNENPEHRPEAALVVGLGQVGELTPGRLEGAVRDTLLEYALQLLEHQRGSGGAAPAQGGRINARISSLLVGTGASSLDVRESVEALLRGTVAANRRLEEAKLDHRVLFVHLELLELFEDLALSAARELSVLLESAELGSRLQWPERVVIHGEGGMQRSRISADTGWWQRIEITEDRKADRLRFVVTADRARAEENLAFGQLRLVDSFIAQASASTASKRDVSKTLFEMLLPQRFKESAPDQRQMVLIVDDSSARFPWELLEDRWSHLGQPQAVVSGIVRQLKTSEFREQVNHTSDNSLFVVGNPNLQGWDAFSDLPGARREAEAVNTLFRGQGFDSLTLVDTGADDILAGLHSRPWKVLHLAGHGEHEFEVSEGEVASTTVLLPAGGRMQVPERVTLADGSEAVPVPRRKRVSGMVIGKDTFLTPGDVAQMRHVPELVFINCCHLGQTQRKLTAYNRLAANLGAEFIRMGVRAVVCAGWAVDDAAALTFAQGFYKALLEGMDFGAAVTRARRDTWNKHPRVNTWGAYQCYGDPGWRLVRDSQVRTTTARPDFLSYKELLVEADNARAGSRNRPPEWVRERVEALLARIPQALRHEEEGGWLARADVCAAIGQLFGEARLFEESVHWLDKAMRCDAGACPMQAFDQGVNHRIRLAADQWAGAAGEPSAEEAARARLRADLSRRIGEDLQSLAAVQARAPTRDRRRILGSAYKRSAWILQGEERVLALFRMTEQYREAFDAARRQDSYSFTNWASGCLLLERADRRYQGGGWHGELRDLCRAQAERTRAAQDERPSFWGGASQGDLKVVELLLEADDAAEVQGLAAQAQALYEAARRRGASGRELGSVREHLEFLLAICSENRPAWPKAVLQALEALIACLK